MLFINSVIINASADFRVHIMILQEASSVLANARLLFVFAHETPGKIVKNLCISMNLKKGLKKHLTSSGGHAKMKKTIRAGRKRGTPFPVWEFHSHT